jgi:hypothetical protein
MGGIKVGRKVYGKQDSSKSQDFPLGGKIRSKMAPVNKKILKVPKIKNNFFFETQKPATTPTFCKRIFFPMHHIKNVNFLFFRLRLGSRRFVLKHHVNKNIFKNKVGIGYMYTNKQLLTPKKGMDYYRSFLRKLV